MTGPREQLFDERISSKLAELTALAEEHGLPMFAVFVLDDGKVCTVSGRAGDAEASETIWRLGAVARRGWRPIGPMEDSLISLNEDLAAKARHFDRYGRKAPT